MLRFEGTEALTTMAPGATWDGEMSRASGEFVATTTISQFLIASREVACRTSKSRPMSYAALMHALDVESSRELDPSRPTSTSSPHRVARIMASAEPMFPAAPTTAAVARPRSIPLAMAAASMPLH